MVEQNSFIETSKNSSRGIAGKAVLILCLVLSQTVLGCKNFLTESADKETADAIIFEARKLMDRRDYTSAIDKLETLSAADLATRSVAVLRASAYAGRCGLDFIQFVEELQDLDDSTTLLQLFLSVMKDADDYADCVTAETLLKTVGATADLRTKDENTLLAFVSFAKIGAILATSGNADDDDDGEPDAGFNACTQLTREDGAEIGTGIAIAIESLTSASADLFGDAVSQLGDVCTLIGGCETDTSDYSNAERDAIRTAVHSSDGEVGLGTQDPTTDFTKICVAEGA